MTFPFAPGQAPSNPAAAQSFSPFAALNSAQINSQEGPAFVPNGTGSFKYVFKKLTFNPAGASRANLTFDLEVTDVGDFQAVDPAKAGVVRVGSLVRVYQGYDQPVKQAPYVNAFLFATMGYHASDAAAKAAVTPFFEAVIMAAITGQPQQANGQTIKPDCILDRPGVCTARPGKKPNATGDYIPFLTFSPAQ